MTPTTPTADAAPPNDPPAAAGTATSPWLAAALWAAFVAIALFANLGALRGHGFLWTDRALIQDNALLNSLGGVQRIWAGLFDPSSVRLPQYAPLAQVTFFFDRLIWGDRVGGYRLTSCLLHATAGLMLWHLLRRLALPGAVAVALLFVAHPISVESVALLTERRTILATLLAFASAFLMLRALGVIGRAPGTRDALPDDPLRLYAMAATLFVIGLFAHASIAAVPAVVLLLAWWRRRPVDSTAAGVCAALLIAGVAMLSFDSLVESARSDVPAEQWRRAPTAAGDIATRAQLAGRAVGFYATKLAVPFPLMIDYPRWRTPIDVAVRRQFLTPTDLSTRRVRFEPDVAPTSLIDWAWPIGIVAALGALFAAAGRVGRGPFVAAATFVLCLLPVVGFLDLGWMANSFVADRAAYLASVPFFAAIVALLAPYLLVATQRTAALWTLAVVLFAYLVLANGISRRYADPLTFWAAAANERRGNPRSALAQIGFADALLASEQPDLKDVAAAYENARFQRPGDPTVHLRIASLYESIGQPDKALAKVKFVLDYFPDDVRGPMAAGDLYRRLADAKPTDPSLRRNTLNAYRAACERAPGNAWAQAMRGVTAYEIVARLPDPRDPQIADLLEETASAFNESVQSDPYDPGRLVLMARTLIAMGRLADASNLLRSAITFDRKRPDAYELLGEASIKGGNIRGAEAAIRQAIALDSRQAGTQLKLGSLLQGLGRFDEAKPVLARALELDPQNAETKRRLAEVEAGSTGTSTTQPAPPTTRAATTAG